MTLKSIIYVEAAFRLTFATVASQADQPLQPTSQHFAWTANSIDSTLDKFDLQVTSPNLIELGDPHIPRAAHITSTLKSAGAIRVSPRHNGGSLSPASTSGASAASAPHRESPEASSTASDSPTPTNSVQEKNWTDTHWQGLVSEERCQLLGTEEESSDRHSSGSDSDEDNPLNSVWTITPEQSDYYCAQFRSLQPDLNGLIAGAEARLFFEKSRLPLQELKKIWQLADVTKDGALSLEEFKTAMHLVVLRRNSISLPDTLPLSLVPTAPVSAAVTAPVPAAPPIPEKREKREKLGSEESLTSATSPQAEGSPQKGKDVSKWTKFVDSPTSSVSSPGPKPVNFDFHKSAVEQDPKILHPVPLRLTPESQGIAVNNDDGGEPCRSPRRLTSDVALEADGSIAPPDIRPIQRPQPKKPAAPGPGAIPPPPPPSQTQAVVSSTTEESTLPTQQGFQLSGPTSLPVGLKKDPPPPPPPRPYRTHARSSSLDLNRYDGVSGKSTTLLGAPPVVPPRVSPSCMSPRKLKGQHSEGADPLHQGFADFAQFDSQTEGDALPRKHGAFEVYRKPTPKNIVPTSDSTVDNQDETLQSWPTRHHAEDGTSFQQVQDRNAALLRTCHQLTMELAELQIEKAELEIQLEQLRSALPR